MIKSSFLFLFFILILSSFVFALNGEYRKGSTVYFSEDFNYSNNYLSNGWQNSYGSPCQTLSPVSRDSIFNNGAFGLNQTGSSNGCSSYIQRRNLIDMPSNGIYMISFNYTTTTTASIIQNTDYTFAMFTQRGIGGPQNDIYIYENGTQRLYNFDGTGYDYCTYDMSEDGVVYNLKLVVDIDNNEQELWIKKSSESDYTLSCNYPYSLASINTMGLIAYGGNNALGITTEYTMVDDIEITSAEQQEDTYSEYECETLPVIKCNPFDYNYSIKSYGWDVNNFDGSINYTWKPLFSDPADITTGYAKMQGNEPESTGYDSVRPFNFWVETSDGAYISSYPDAPMFGITYDFNTSFEDGSSFYTYVSDSSGLMCNIFRVNNNNNQKTLSFLNETVGSYNTIQNLNNESSYQIRINYKFGDLNKDYDFNTTDSIIDLKDLPTGLNHMRVILTDLTLGTSNKYYLLINDECRNINRVRFEKDTLGSVFYIDEYKHFIGWDENTESLAGLFTSPYQDQASYTEPINSTSTDFYDTVLSLWDSFGLTSSISKTLFGLVLLVISGIMLAVAMITQLRHFNTIAFTIIMGLITTILVFVGLIPIWILVLFAILGASMGAGAVALNLKN